MPTRLFIYGTLKRGHGRHDAISRQRFIGEAVTQPHYLMYNCIAYPALVEVAPGQGQPIRGEVWVVDDRALARVDAIEDVHTGLYRRRSIALATPEAEAGGESEGESGGVQSYFFQGGVDDLELVGEQW